MEGLRLIKSSSLCAMDTFTAQLLLSVHQFVTALSSGPLPFEQWTIDDIIRMSRTANSRSS
jgi:hypothetical protein